MKKQKNEIQRYGVLQNIGYCLANVWNWDKSFYLGFVPKIFLSVSLPLALIYFPKMLIDMITKKAPQRDIIILVGVFCALFALFELISVFAGAKLSSMRDIFRIRYRDMCEKKYKRTDYENTENPKINDLYNGAMNSTGDAENIVDSLNTFLINILGIIGYGGIIIALNPLILLLILACTAINYLMQRAVRLYTVKSREKWTPIDRRNGYLYTITYAYEKIKDIKLYPYTGLINALTDKCHKERLFWHKKVWNREALPSVGDGVLALLRNAVVYYILLTQFINGVIDVGMFVFYFGAVTGFSVWLGSVSGQFNGILQMSMNINYIRSFLEIRERFNHGPSKHSSDVDFSSCDIELENLTFRYPACESDIISGISLRINKNEKIALVGPNGAGKTTLVKLMCGLYYPGEGDMRINGVHVRDFNIDEYYRLFSVVFQDIHIMPISFAQFVSGSGADIDRRRVTECLELAGLGDKVKSCARGIDTTFYKDIYEDDPGTELSGGEKQKLLLARALYKNAPIIILDEPTASLDPIAESEMYQKFHAMTKNKTAVYISHRLASTRFCDRILFIENGKIAESGNHEQLMAKKGRYYEMFEVQSHYYKGGLCNEHRER